MNCVLFLYFFVFLFGLTVGSFLNCVIYRLYISESFLEGRPREKTSFLRGRSYCPYCEHKLSWQDLIPILSFFILKGRCRYCHQKISWQYPLVELTTAILFVLVVYYAFPNLLVNCYLLLITCLLVIIFVYDLKYYIIPDEVIYPAIGTGLVYNIISYFILNTSYSILNTIYSAFGAVAFFLAIFLLSRGKWLGFGDVKLALFMGLFLGFPNILVALFSAFLIGAIIGLGLILVGKKTLKSKVPFGPFLVTGTFIALFFGNQIINWYLNFLGPTI